tara:strand:- start:251 stop:484 length:234 start_codon:yes stop_codon:yes gene_type:complete
LIASRQPDEIIKLVERYNKDHDKTEANYIDVVIRSEGSFSYQDIMTMPVNSIRLLIERMNNRIEEINKQNKRASGRV